MFLHLGVVYKEPTLVKTVLEALPLETPQVKVEGNCITRQSNQQYIFKEVYIYHITLK